MKIHDFAFAPNPRKVRIYLAEKGIKMDFEKIDILQGEQHNKDFLAKNPQGLLPILELDDGSYLTESLVIMEYLEELFPEPSMIGHSAIERARTREIERFIETSLATRINTIFFHTSQVFQDRQQVQEIATYAQQGLEAAFSHLNNWIGNNPFIAGEQPSIADCTLMAAIEHGARVNIKIAEEHRQLARWYEAFRQRPSVTS